MAGVGGVDTLEEALEGPAELHSLRGSFWRRFSVDAVERVVADGASPSIPLGDHA